MQKRRRYSKIPVINRESEPVEHLYTNPYNRYYEYDLNGALIVPSMVHAHSLLIEYMQEFFISKFDHGYFKTIFINGKHVMDDYLRRSKTSKLKVEKPALAITPVPNREYDRDLLDSYMGGPDDLINKFNYNKAFFKDYTNNIFLGFNIKEIEMAFNFKVRLSTRAQQEDMYENMRLRFRIGYTTKDFISCDFHIPYDLILNIASSAGFETDNNDRIKDIIGFLSYLNQHSEYPFIYKIRSINGNNEFFIRVSGIYVWVDTRNPLSADDGDREGQLYTNFHIDMEAIARMWVPHFYVFKTAKKIINDKHTTNTSGIGLYSLVYVELPEENDKGWTKEISTTYVADEIINEPLTIPMEELFEQNKLIMDLISYTRSISISPNIFIDILCTNGTEYVAGKMNWKTLEFTLDKSIDYLETHIGIYLNKEYINSQISVIEDIRNTRLS